MFLSVKYIENILLILHCIILARHSRDIKSIVILKTLESTEWNIKLKIDQVLLHWYRNVTKIPNFCFRLKILLMIFNILSIVKILNIFSLGRLSRLDIQTGYVQLLSPTDSQKVFNVPRIQKQPIGCSSKFCGGKLSNFELF